MSLSTSLNRWISPYFIPLPEEKSSTAPSRKSDSERVVAYLDSSAGSWDFFRVAELFASYVKAFPGLSPNSRKVADKVSSVMNLSGAALSLPEIFSDGHKLYTNVCQWRSHKTPQAAKQLVVDGAVLTNTLAQAALFLHQTALIDVAKHLPGIDCIYQGTSLLIDGVELVEEAYKIDAYHAAQARECESQEVSRLEEKERLSWMKIVKDTASVALALIALGAILCGVVVEGSLLAIVVLGLSTVWLTMKIACYFYDKILAERHASPALGAL